MSRQRAQTLDEFDRQRIGGVADVASKHHSRLQAPVHFLIPSRIRRENAISRVVVIPVLNLPPIAVIEVSVRTATKFLSVCGARKQQHHGGRKTYQWSNSRHVFSDVSQGAGTRLALPIVD